MDTSFVEFRQLREVWVFSYLVYSLAKSLINDLGVVRLEMAMDFGSKEAEPRLMKGLSMDLGLLKTVPVCALDRKGPCEFA